MSDSTHFPPLVRPNVQRRVRVGCEFCDLWERPNAPFQAFLGDPGLVAANWLIIDGWEKRLELLTMCDSVPRRSLHLKSFDITSLTLFVFPPLRQSARREHYLINDYGALV